MLKYISCALLLTIVQANLNVLPKFFRMEASSKDLNYDSSESSEAKPVTVTEKTHINKIFEVPQTKQVIQQNNEMITNNNKMLTKNKKIHSQVTKIQFNDTQEDDVIKKKLFKLVKEAKIDIDGKMATIDKVHEDYKNKGLYKIGYIVSFLNKTYEELLDAYRYVDDNKQDWDVLKILNSYEKVKNGNDFVSDLLNILQKVLKDRHKQKKARGQNSSVPSVSDRIAWNYYDDS